MVTSSLTPSSLLDAPSGDLVLRVCGSTRHGQLIRLRSAKCTIGSGPRCTLRLRAKGVGALHCLILRGTARTVVRRWAADTRLNGRAFADAELAPGDRLDVGAIELEVLDLGRPADSAPAEIRETHLQEPDKPAPQLEAEREKLQLQRQEIEQTQRQWQAERKELERQLRERAEELDARWAELDGQREALEEQRRGWEARQAESESRSAEQLDARRAELEAKRQELEQQQQQWHAERKELERQLRERAEELDARWAELDGRREELEEQRRGWEARQAESESRSAEQLDAPSAEQDVQEESFQQEGGQWEIERGEVQQQLDQQTAELEARQAESETQPPPAEPAIESEPSQAPASRETPHEGPIDLESVFPEAGPAGWSRDDELPESPLTGPAPNPLPDDKPAEVATTAASPTAPTQWGEHAGEESIDDYMARLMERLRVGPEGAKRREPELRQPDEPANPATPEPPTPDEPPATPPAPTRRQPVELAPRAVAPENRDGLAAMRELANLSAHTAIDQHARRQKIRAGRGRLLTALVGLVSGGILAAIWWGTRSDGLAYYAAFGSFLVALIWGVQYAVLARRNIDGRSGDPAWNSGEGQAEEGASASGEDALSPKDRP